MGAPPRISNRNDVPWHEVKGPWVAREEIRVTCDATGALLVESEAGVWRSSDEGATFSRLPASDRMPPHEGSVVEAVAPDGTRWRSIERHELEFYRGDPDDPHSILESANVIVRFIARSTDGGASWATQ